MSALRLLLVEDSEVDAALLAAALKQAGYDLTLERVETGAALSAALRAGPWDIVVADYTLPSFDAERALEIFKASGLDAPFLVLSGTIGEERATAIVRAGAHDFVLKGNPQRAVYAIERELRDASERRARRLAEARLRESERQREKGEEANRLKDEFLATVSHELRTPLTAILGWCNLAQRMSPPPDIARALTVIDRNARAQAKLIEDILDISRIMTGKLRLHIEPADVERSIRGAADAVAPAAAAKGIELRVQVEPEVGVIAADPDRLQQIVWNILTNAVKFTPGGGRVEISARREGARIVIVARDNGRGISPDFLPFVFEPFRQADASTTRAQGGIGLGLSIVKQLVSAHGGTIHAESDGEGRGTTVVIELPARPLPAVVRSPRGESPTAGAPAAELERLDGLRLVVVDDEQDARELLEALLTSVGATVRTASSALDALRLVEQLRPDVLLSDVGMPDVDGYALIQALRRMDDDDLSRTPAIAITAYTRREDLERTRAAGFQAYCSKPCDAAELVSLVHRVSGRSSPAESSRRPQAGAAARDPVSGRGIR